MALADREARVEDLLMPDVKRDWKSGSWAVFFWSGVVMALACLALVLAGNTEMVFRLERTSLPLSWVFGIVAILEFATAEICHHADARARDGEKRPSQPARQAWEAWEF